MNVRLSLNEFTQFSTVVLSRREVVSQDKRRYPEVEVPGAPPFYWGSSRFWHRRTEAQGDFPREEKGVVYYFENIENETLSVVRFSKESQLMKLEVLLGHNVTLSLLTLLNGFSE